MHNADSQRVERDKLGYIYDKCDQNIPDFGIEGSGNSWHGLGAYYCIRIMFLNGR